MAKIIEPCIDSRLAIPRWEAIHCEPNQTPIPLPQFVVKEQQRQKRSDEDEDCDDEGIHIAPPVLNGSGFSWVV